ncbi:hypothetical protein [Nonomuraea sp. NPDC050783]|uniref:hypothetical protein n=1 Tax=Nonomuraea sp. NPDC050783 TaxID=3154634 RepID=UPI003466DA8B
MDMPEVGWPVVLWVLMSGSRDASPPVFLLQAMADRVIAVLRDEPIGKQGRPCPPVLGVIEEARTFVCRASAGRMRALLDQLQVGSRCGRKR